MKKLNKKGFIHHPIVLMIVAFLLGLIVMYLIAIDIIPILNICSVVK